MIVSLKIILYSIKWEKINDGKSNAKDEKKN